MELRGSNARIKHYISYENGKRKYVIHSVFIEQLGINGNQKLGIKTPEELPKMVRGVGFEPTNLYRIGASGLRL